MAFPTTALPVKVELQLAGVWTDITARTRLTDPIDITRGRRDESGSFEPGECSLVLNNADGRFSSRNPMGPYYGLLTRNTPIRVSVLAGSGRLLLPALTDTMSTPDSAGLSITGDIDLRVDASLPSWSITSNTRSLLSKASAGQSSYRFQLGSFLQLEWSTDGTALNTITSLVKLPTQTGRQSVRVTFDVDNGAGGKTATFYYGPSVAGPWTQLGPAVTSAGTTTIFDGTAAAAVVGSASAATTTYAAEIRQGIAGTVRANPDFTVQSEGATSFVDGVGNTWTVTGTATLTARRYRFYGEVSSWPQAWDISERNGWVSTQAAGPLRRLGQGVAPLRGPIQRFVLRSATVAYAYWPMEDESEATSIASGLTAGSAMSIQGTPDLASSEIFPSSGPLPALALASLSGPVNSYTPTNIISVQLLLSVPATGDGNNGVIFSLYTSGTAPRWDLSYITTGTGDLNLRAYDAAGTSLQSTTMSIGLNGQPAIVTLQLVQNGANIDWLLIVNGYFAGNTLPGPTGATLNSRTVGGATFVQVNPNQLLDGTVVGHLTVNAAVPVNADVVKALRGYVAETAGTRLTRLCAEESIPFTLVGASADTAAMGVQHSAQLLELFAECEAADMGQLFESREQLGLAYRTRASRYLQPAALALDYAALGGLQPIEDDQNTRNDMTVSRINGGSARVTVDTGPLSTQAPPAGVGRYDENVEISLAADSQCLDQANWRTVAGTIDEPRYPVIRAQLGSARIGGVTATLQAALDLDCGDLLTVTSPPVWVPPDRIDQHVIGYSESLGVRDYPIDYVCVPITPAGNTAVYDGTARYSSDGSSLASPMTSSATSASVATPTGPLWTIADGAFDVVIGGERMTVTNITGASSPQTFTVTRSINGVTKAQTASTSVDLYRPPRYAL